MGMIWIGKHVRNAIGVVFFGEEAYRGCEQGATWRTPLDSLLKRQKWRFWGTPQPEGTFLAVINP